MFRRGDRVRIERDINAIPAGIYKFIQDENGLLFGCGTALQVGLSVECMASLKKVPRSVPLSTPEEIVPRYYQLLDEISRRPTSAGGPMSFGGVDAGHPLIRKHEARAFPGSGPAH